MPFSDYWVTTHDSRISVSVMYLKRAIDPVSILDWILRVVGSYELMKKLYDHLDPEKRWTIRLLMGGTLSVLPTALTCFVLLVVGILPIGLNGNPMNMLGGASVLPLVFLVTFRPLWRALGQYINFNPPKEYLAWAVSSGGA